MSRRHCGRWPKRCAKKLTEAYEKLGTANAPEAGTFYWQAEEFDLALQLATRVELEQLGIARPKVHASACRRGRARDFTAMSWRASVM